MCLVSELVATPTGSLIMAKINLNTAMIAATALEFSGIFVLLVTPETLCRSTETRSQPNEDNFEDIPSQATPTRANDESNPEVAGQSETMPTVKSLLRHAMELLSRPFELVFTNRTILLGLPAFLTSRLLRQVVSLLLQYVSKKLGWTIAAVSLLT